MSKSVLPNIRNFNENKYNDLISLLKYLDFYLTTNNNVLLNYSKIVDNRLKYYVSISKLSNTINLSVSDYFPEIKINHIKYSSASHTKDNIYNSKNQNDIIIQLRKIFVIELRKNKIKNLLDE